MKLIVILYSLPPSPNGCKSKDHYSSESWNIMDDWGYGSWGMDRIARWGMDRGMDRGVWIACGPGPLIHTLHFDLHPYIYIYDICHGITYMDKAIVETAMDLWMILESPIFQP